MLLTNGFDPDVRVYKEANHIVKQGHDLTILCWDRKCEYEKVQYLNGYKIIRLHIPSIYGTGFRQIIPYIKFLIKAKEHIQSNSYDIIHCHDLDAATTILLLPLKRRTFVFDMHEIYVKKSNKIYNFFVSLLLNRLHDKAKFIIGVTDCQKKYISNRNIYKYISLPNYPCSQTYTSINKEKSRLIRIAYIGSVRDYKSLKILIDVATKYKGKYIFRIDGMGSAFDHLIEYTKSNDLECILTGKFNGVKDISRLYQTTDVLYCAYDNDNNNWSQAIPVKLYEGIITETPMIVNRGGEAAKLVKEYDIGYVIDINDFASFDQLLLKINDDTSYKKKIENIKKIKHFFDWDEIVKHLDVIYK